MNIYRELDRSRIQFDFVYFTGDRCDFDEEIESLGGHIHRIEAPSTLGRFFALYRLLRGGGWKILHSHTLLSSSLHVTAARLAGVPVRITHSHNTQDDNGGSRVGRAYQRLAKRVIGWGSTQYVACGQAAAQYLFPGRKNVLVVPNGIDIDKFENASGEGVRDGLGISARHLVVLQVARFMPVKNHAFSIRIAEAMRRAGIDFRMLLVGTGRKKSEIEKLVADSNLEQHVHFMGLRSDIPDLMTAADVMFLPSHYEGFGVVLVEAQAAGLPSVASNGVPQEADVGLGLVRFVALDAGDDEWIEALQAAARVRVPDKKTRQEVLERAGFSSAAGARLLEGVYGAA